MQKISFTTLSTPGQNVRDVASLARRYGYDGVDLRVSNRAGEIVPDAGAAEIKAARDALLAEGVEAAGLLCYLSYEDLPPAQLAASLRRQLERHLAIAVALGARSIRIGGGRSETGPCFDELAQALAGVLPQAGDIDIVIQNHADAFTAAECLALVKAMDHPRFKLAFSPDHCVIVGEGFRSVFPELVGRTRKLFIADLRMEGGKHETVLPGLGAVPVVESYAAAGGAAFDGWITFKYERFWDPKLLGPEVSLPYFIERAPLWFDGWKKNG